MDINVLQNARSAKKSVLYYTLLAAIYACNNLMELLLFICESLV